MGLIVTVMGVATFGASIPLGIVADKCGRKRLHIAGNILASAIIAVFALTTNIAVLLAAVVAEGIAEAAFAASGVSSAVCSLPNALSSFVGAYLMSLGLLAAPFFLSGIFYVISILLFWYF